MSFNDDEDPAYSLAFSTADRTDRAQMSSLNNGAVCDDDPFYENKANNNVELSDMKPAITTMCYCNEPCVHLQAGPNAKNPGRLFLKCSKFRDDPTQCKYFEWEDEIDKTKDTKIAAYSPAPLRRRISGGGGYAPSHPTNQQQQEPQNQPSLNTTNDTCFKCSQTGHWSRDCHNQPTATNNNTNNNSNYQVAQHQQQQQPGTYPPSTAPYQPITNITTTSSKEVPGIICHCNIEVVRLMAGQHTKNAGRYFLKCSKFRDDPTQCKFFEWEDEYYKPGGDGGGNDGGGNQYNNHNHNYSQPASYAPSTSNQQPQGQQKTGCFNCGGDHWVRDCPEKKKPYNSNTGGGGGGGYDNNNNNTNGGGGYGGQSYRGGYGGGGGGGGGYGGSANNNKRKFDNGAGAGGASGSVCFICQETGHWAKDCPQKKY